MSLVLPAANIKQKNGGESKNKDFEGLGQRVQTRRKAQKVYAAYLIVSDGVTAMTASQTPAPSPATQNHDVQCPVKLSLAT